MVSLKEKITTTIVIAAVVVIFIAAYAAGWIGG